MWPLTVVAVVLVLAATFLQLSKRAFDLKRLETLRSYHPCVATHDFVVIELKPLDGAQFTCKHTAALYCCKKCKAHQTVCYPGEWEISSFLKGESDKAQLARMMGAGK